MEERRRNNCNWKHSDMYIVNSRNCIIIATLALLVVSSALYTCVTPVRATAGSVEILSYSGYRDPSGNYRIVGEVQNTESPAVTFIQVSSKFYDSSNHIIDSRFDLTMISVLLVGRKSPFEIALLDVAESTRVVRYDLNATCVETDPLPMKLEILSLSNYTDADKSFHVAGALKNLGDERLVNAKIVATYYDTSAHVVAAAVAGFDAEQSINPNQTVSFEIKLDKDRAQYVSTYTVNAESDQYAAITDSPTQMAPPVMPLAILSFCAILFCTIWLYKRRTSSKTRRRRERAHAGAHAGRRYTFPKDVRKIFCENLAPVVVEL